jgi:fructose-1-phosphate kinase PfkB-like protein
LKKFWANDLIHRARVSRKNILCVETKMTPTVYTLTGNLLWERTLEFAAWSPGKTQRAKSDSFQVGGKGINVSRMLTRLGAPTTALCFAGGSTGADCIEWFEAKGIDHHVFPTSAATRIGTVVRSCAHPETTFLSPDVAPDSAAWNACARYIDALPEGHVLALCGSFPGWSTPAAEPLRAALIRWSSRGSLVADTYGPPLEWALQQPLAVVKINRDEFDGIDQATAKNEPFAARLSTRLAHTQARAWIVTDSEKPVWLIQRNSEPRQIAPPHVSLVSSTGSGDVLFACLLHGYFHRKLSLFDALAAALPYAAANAGHPGIAEFDLNNLLA